MNIDVAMQELLGLMSSHHAQVDALRAVVLALLREHPRPDRVLEHFDVEMHAEEARILVGATASSDPQVDHTVHAWLAVRDLLAAELDSRALGAGAAAPGRR